MSILARIAGRAEDRLRLRVADAVRAAAPGVTVEVTREGLAIEGKSLSRDARLRWIGGLIR